MSMSWEVVNQSDKDLRVGCFGIDNSLQARLEVPAGQSCDFPGNLSDGHRVFVAWDEETQDVVCNSPFPVRSSLGATISLYILDNLGMDVAYS